MHIPTQILAYCLFTATLFATESGTRSPTFADVPYGTDTNQKMDIYLPDGNGPFPFVMYIHGGSWMNGDKAGKINANLLQNFLKNQVAFISINYRFIPQAEKAGVFPPVLMPLNDARYALQYIRYHAADWNLLPDNAVLLGGSAGAFSALWLGLSPDMANPEAADPVEQMSTRVHAIGCYSAQTSLDPKQMHDWVGDQLHYGGHAFGEPNFASFLENRSKYEQYYPNISPAELIDPEDPPVYLNYRVPTKAPKTGDFDATHSAAFGVGFKEVAENKNATCYLQYPGHTDEPGQEKYMVHFLIKAAKAN